MKDAATIGLSGNEMLDLELGLRALIHDRERFIQECPPEARQAESERLQRDRQLLEKWLRIDFRSNAILEFVER